MSREEFGFRNMSKTFSSFGTVMGFSCRDLFLLIVKVKIWSERSYDSNDYRKNRNVTHAHYNLNYFLCACY